MTIRSPVTRLQPRQSSSTRRRRLIFKACPRCKGDLLFDDDEREGVATFTCIQCGWEGALLEIAPDWDSR